MLSHSVKPPVATDHSATADICSLIIAPSTWLSRLSYALFPRFTSMKNERRRPCCQKRVA